MVPWIVGFNEEEGRYFGSKGHVKFKTFQKSIT